MRIITRRSFVSAAPALFGSSALLSSCSQGTEVEGYAAVSAVRPQFADAMGLKGQRPDLVVRFGRGPTLPPSLRQPVQALLSQKTMAETQPK